MQFERAILSPVYYLTAMGIMYALQASGRPYGESFVVGFVAGIVVTRTIHTIWGVRTGTFRDKEREEVLEIRTLNNARAARGRKGKDGSFVFKPVSVERVE